MSNAASDQPLHAQRPTERFSDRADDYAKYRPSYPVEAIDAFLSEVPPAGHRVIADIGAGTGISSRLLADRAFERGWSDARIIAVEPNAPMRDAAASHSHVKWHDGSAERTHLPSGSVSGVLCAQSFHWFEPASALAEFHRILDPDSVVGLLWNERDNEDPLTGEYGRLIVAAAGGHPAAQRVDHHEPLRHSPLFRGYCSQVFAAEQALDVDGFLGRARSASYCPKDGPGWTSLKRDLSALHAKFAGANGRATLRYVTHLYTAHANTR